VDVVLIRSVSDSGSRRDYSDLLLQDVKVIAVDQIATEQKDRPTVAKAVTLEVTPYDAQKISLATNLGHLSLILRKAGDSNVVVDRRVTESDLSVTQPNTPKPPPPPAGPAFSDVTIMRNLKSQDYKVVRDAR
jgi:pilus assembly protein CpaB